MSLKNKVLKAVMPFGGYTSCLPPVRRVRVAAPVEVVVPAAPKSEASCAAKARVETGLDINNMCDAELLQLEPAVKLLKGHDWHYDYSDDGSVWRAGKAHEALVFSALAKLSLGQAELLWSLYAPASLGGYLAAAERFGAT